MFRIRGVTGFPFQPFGGCRRVTMEQVEYTGSHD
jgi:hypothetical protein